MPKRRLPFIIAGMWLLAFIFVWVSAGCGGGGGSSSGSGSLKVSLVDAPMQADEINVDIKSIEVSNGEAAWTTIKEFPTPLHVNLLDYRTGGKSLLLADAPLGAGHYTMVRLMLASAEVVADGQHYQVELRNVAQTGVKCNGEFDVQSNQQMALMLDFNAGRSFVKTGNGTYMLHPVMTMSPVNIAAEVKGKVEMKDGTGAVVATLPTDLVVNLYKAGHTAADAPVASTVVESDGSFDFSVITQGSYDLEVAEGDDTNGYTSLYTQAGVTVTPPSTDLGTITVTAKP